MKLLKRLLSFGGKKNNKKNRPAIVHDVPVPEPTWLEPTPLDHEEHEAAVGRILRTSSARHRESRTIEYPPMLQLPHPINDVIPTPASSSVSIASTTISQRGTYNVTVHQRKRHASTEFPYANRDQNGSKDNRNSLAPKEDSRVLRLRSDPSVVSLIELYDDHGKISADAFANDSGSVDHDVPINQGRAQCKRSGSTLRQLLGFPTPNGQDNSEGDISWAERVLGETEGSSMNSSIGLPTPADTHLNHDISFISDVDVSMISEINNPAISSMEVELSLTSNMSNDSADIQQNNPYIHAEPNTPQRASQVFDFITRGKQSKPAEALERDLPQLPSTFSSPSDENTSLDNIKSRFSTTTSEFTFISPSAARVSQYNSETTPKKIPQPRFAFASETPRPSHNAPRSAVPQDNHVSHLPSQVMTPPVAQPDPESKINDIHILMTGPTKVILTAPTPSTNHVGPSRSLHGPRSIPRKSSSGNKRRRSALGELSNGPSREPPVDPFLAQPPDSKRIMRRRSSSVSSTHSSKSVDQAPEQRSKVKKSDFFSVSPRRHKENQLGLSVKTELPATPLRTNTTPSRPRSLMRTAVHQNMNIFRPPKDVILPSPASSSEMSPVGRKMMMDVREQRMKAREAERERSAKRHDRNVFGRF